MTRHTRSKQLIKLAMMQGEDVKFEKWNYSPRHNLTIEDSIKEAIKWDTVLDTSFKWVRFKNMYKTYNWVQFASTCTLTLGDKTSEVNCEKVIHIKTYKYYI